MKRGRKTSSTSGYVMNKHKNGKYFYAYTLRPFNVDGKTVYRRCQWGRLDEDLKFSPGLSFMLLTEEERAKFVFPKEWDISELDRIAELAAKPNPTVPSKVEDSPESLSNPLSSDNESLKDILRVIENENEDEDTSDPLSKYYKSSNGVSGIDTNCTMLCGATWLIEIWARKIGLWNDLMTAFYNDKYKVDVFISLVIYSLTHNYSLDNFFTTQSYIKYPASDIMGEVELGKINASTGDREIEKFFECWMRRSKEGELYAFDSTLTVDTHADSNMLGIKGKVFGFGYDIEEALKSEFIILYSMSTGYPLCYINYGEDNDDFQSFYDALSRFRLLGAEDFTLFTNRRYDGVHLQVGLLASEGQKLLLPSDVKAKDVMSVIEGIEIEDHLPTNMQWDEKGDVYYIQVRNDFESGKKIGPDTRINVYYSPEKDMRDRMKIQHRIGNMNSNVESLVGQPNMVQKEDFSRANDLIDIEYSAATSNNKFSVVKSGSVNRDKVSELTRISGFFAARSFNMTLKPKDIINVFRFASEHTLDFGILKDILNLQRPYNDHRLPVLKKIIQGKRFVLFLALIISSSLKRVLSSKPLLSKVFRDDIQMIMEMLSLKGEYKDGKLVNCSVLTPRQRLIIHQLHLDQCPGKDMSEVTGLLYKRMHEDKN